MQTSDRGTQAERREHLRQRQESVPQSSEPKPGSGSREDNQRHLCILGPQEPGGPVLPDLKLQSSGARAVADFDSPPDPMESVLIHKVEIGLSLTVNLHQGQWAPGGSQPPSRERAAGQLTRVRTVVTKQAALLGFGPRKP